MRKNPGSHKDKRHALSHTVLEWLDGDQYGASVLTTARMLLSIERATKRILPVALAQTCKVAHIDRQQITLAVPSAAYAARLRQLAPRIVHLLAEDGWNLNEIRIRVQAGLLQSRTKTARAKESIPLDDSALEAFEALRRGLDPGPLADAVGRLLAHHRNNS